MQSGLLTGTMTEERIKAMPEDDWRRRSPDFTGPALQLNLAIAGLFKSIAARHHTTTPAVAIAWTLAWPGVTAAIVGARSPEQVDGWVGASQLMLEEADLEEIAATLERTGAGKGPVRPDDWQHGLNTQSGRENQRKPAGESFPDV
jgi:aryl-alcohol dehydrogenase-like predicted oxidoreductase